MNHIMPGALGPAKSMQLKIQHHLFGIEWWATRKDKLQQERGLKGSVAAKERRMEEQLLLRNRQRVVFESLRGCCWCTKVCNRVLCRKTEFHEGGLTRCQECACCCDGPWKMCKCPKKKPPCFDCCCLACCGACKYCDQTCCVCVGKCLWREIVRDTMDPFPKYERKFIPGEHAKLNFWDHAMEVVLLKHAGQSKLVDGLADHAAPAGSVEAEIADKDNATSSRRDRSLKRKKARQDQANKVVTLEPAAVNTGVGLTEL